MAEELPSGLPGELPRFQTWYGRDDFQRMFHRLYLGLGVEGRAARAPFDDAAIDEALGWNVEAVHEAESWPAERFQAYLDAIDEEAEVGGIGGISRVGYSPGAARHVLASYAQTLPCVYGEPPPAFGEGESPAARQLVRQAVDVGACERREIGPFFVASGEELHAAVDDGPEVSLRLLAGPPEAREEVCAAAPGEPCRAPGPGPITVEVAAGEAGGRAVVAVELGEAQPTWAALHGRSVPDRRGGGQGGLAAQRVRRAARCPRHVGRRSDAPAGRRSGLGRGRHHSGSRARTRSTRSSCPAVSATGWPGSTS